MEHLLLRANVPFFIIYVHCTVKTLYTDTLYNIKILYTVICICINVPFSLNLSPLQQKFSRMSNYMGTISVVVKRLDCILKKSYISKASKGTCVEQKG